MSIHLSNTMHMSIVACVQMLAHVSVLIRISARMSICMPIHTSMHLSICTCSYAYLLHLKSIHMPGYTRAGEHAALDDYGAAEWQPWRAVRSVSSNGSSASQTKSSSCPGLFVGLWYGGHTSPLQELCVRPLQTASHANCGSSGGGSVQCAVGCLAPWIDEYKTTLGCFKKVGRGHKAGERRAK